MRTLITGAGGLLGPYIARSMAEVGDVVGLNRAACDLRDKEATQRIVDSTAPDLVVHCAAFTDVDGCELDPTRAELDNVLALVNIVAACRAAALIHISTDQVYPDTAGPHRENDVGPVNEYGRSKYRAEIAIRDRPRSLILRTNFFGQSMTEGRSSLSDAIQNRLVSGEKFFGFENVRFTPLHASTVAGLIPPLFQKGLTGTFNLGCSDGSSKAEFARMIARHLNLDASLIVSSNSNSISERTHRAHDLRMDSRAIEHAAGIQLPSLQEEISKL